MIDAHGMFLKERGERIESLASDGTFADLSINWLDQSVRRQYVYNFDWLGRPIIQYPQDMVAMQELVWATRPDVIVETGIAHGGSLILSASLLALLDYCDAAQAGVTIDPRKPKRFVVGVDIDIREHNRLAIEAHPLANRIRMIQGSSIEAETVAAVGREVGSAESVLVSLDSNHTHDHVLAELLAYSPMVTPGNYCVVFDTFVEKLPPGLFSNRPWDVGNSPLSAVRAFLNADSRFVIDEAISEKLKITAAPHGFLKRQP